ncbi:hypothetical protein [Paraburkholderia sp. J12]|uniref:hypothetical protein n=1 Tax=Paraburkholderia sp. J12 TaxID=2805432 RepID=UPI002ABDFCE7|nr:hypothetical protein [Paraburkholderia sp. J12]
MSAMKADYRRARSSLNLVAVLVAACVFAPSVSSAPAGGTIHFTGIIVAPPFTVVSEIEAAPPAVLAAPLNRPDGAAGAVTVTYVAEHNSAPIADVSVHAIGEANSGDRSEASISVAARFMDGTGHQLSPDSTGVFHLKRMGGVLSLVARNSGTSNSPASAIVETDYH